jgi:hypothetical protein
MFVLMNPISEYFVTCVNGLARWSKDISEAMGFDSDESARDVAINYRLSWLTSTRFVAIPHPY